MAVEPQMQRRWEEQLAGYVAASFRVTSLGNVASQSVQFVSKLVNRRDPVISAQSSSSEASSRSASSSLSTCWRAGSVHRCCGWRKHGRISIRRGCRLSASATFSTPRLSRSTVRARWRSPPIRGDISFENVSFRYRIDGPEILHDINLEVPAGQVLGIVGTSGIGQKYSGETCPAPLPARKRTRARRRRRYSPGRSSPPAPSDRGRSPGQRAVQLARSGTTSLSQIQRSRPKAS